MKFEQHDVSGLNLRVSRHCAHHEVTLVMTNALPQSIRCWESQWDDLASHFDLLAVDMPGFGESEGSPEVMRPSAQSEVLMAAMDAFDIDQAVLVGPDIGVPITLWTAAKHPERVLGVNVFDGPATWPADFEPGLKAATRSRVVRWLATHAPMRARLMMQNFNTATSAGYTTFSPSPEAVAEYRRLCFDKERHDNAIAFLGSYADELPRLEALLPSIAAPALITWGADDAFVPVSNVDRIHRLLPHSEVEVFDHAGHFSHEDVGRTWVDRLLRFVASATTMPRP